jgi:hypothetical protein
VNTSLRPENIEIAKCGSQRQGWSFEKLAAVVCSHSAVHGAPLLQGSRRVLPGPEQRGAMARQAAVSPVLPSSPALSERSRTSRSPFFRSTLPNRCKAIHRFGPQPSRAWLAPFVQENAKCWRTKIVLPNPSFKGEAQRHGTLAIKRRACGPFCACCPVRHAVGSPP